MADSQDVSRLKASGRWKYANDIAVEGMRHAAVVRSDVQHARIKSIDASRAEAMPGVLGVYTSEDVSTATYGRRVRDIQILAADKVRFIGERVAAVVAETRELAEEAARLVLVEYEPLPAVVTPAEAVAPGAPWVHASPWAYPNAAIAEGDGTNLQSRTVDGDPDAASEALSRSTHQVDLTYRTPAGHHGYVEPQCCVAMVDADGIVNVWASDKGPFRMRDELSEVLAIDPETIDIHLVGVGGDFGGKGAFGDVPLVVQLARITGVPVKLSLRYSEDLVATNPRHSTEIRVRLGCDDAGVFQALRIDALVDGGAYAGFKPSSEATLRGIASGGSAYRIPSFGCDVQVAYTNTVPRGHMRAPGSAQAIFAIESAVDELAEVLGLPPRQLRQRNVLRTGDANPRGVIWDESRGPEVLEAAINGRAPDVAGPKGWLRGSGVAIADRPTTGRVDTSLGLREGDRPGAVVVELPVPDQGSGSHAIARRGIANGLGLGEELVEVEHVSTLRLPYDLGAGGSRVTVALGHAIPALLRAWKERGDKPSVIVDIAIYGESTVTTFCAQAVELAVDPQTGEVEILELLTVVDVADVLNPRAHQMQLDGGAVMGYGFARLEDLRLEDGQVWAGNLGQFKLPSSRDTPPVRTILVEGSKGVTQLNIKAAGEHTNTPTAPAIANAIYDATRARIRELPIRAEVVWRCLNGRASD